LAVLNAVEARLSNWKAALIKVYREQRYLFSSAVRHRYCGFFQDMETAPKADAGVTRAVNLLKLTGGKAWQRFHNERLGALERTGGMSVGALNNIIHKGTQAQAEAAYTRIGQIATQTAPTALAALNNIKGESLAVMELYGYDSPLSLALENNKMERPLFDKYMATAADIGERALKSYLRLVSRDTISLLELERSGDLALNFSQCLDILHRCYTHKSTRMLSIIEESVEKHLIDNEPRAGKRTGACLTELRARGECYILTNDTGGLRGLKSLAHEFGHAYHHNCMFAYSILETRSPMVINECVSKLSELIVSDFLLEKNLITREAARERWLKEIISTMCLVMSRFYFENDFYTWRREAPLSLGSVSLLMSASLQKAFGNGLDERRDYVNEWVLKPHYFYPDEMYYNFPYIIGMISALLIFRKLSRGNITFAELEGVLSITGRLHNYADFLTALKITDADFSDLTEFVLELY
jgi:oligoendopeptidase F